MFVRTCFTPLILFSRNASDRWQVFIQTVSGVILFWIDKWIVFTDYFSTGQDKRIFWILPMSISLLNIVLCWFPDMYENPPYIFPHTRTNILFTKNTCRLFRSVLGDENEEDKKIISFIAGTTFGIYLFQLSPPIWDFLNGNTKFVSEMSFLPATGYILLFSLIIFVSGMIVEHIRQRISKLIGIPKLSQKISQIKFKLPNKKQG